MKIAILGTGIVSRSHAAKLSKLGHTVYMGTGDIKKTRSETEIDSQGNQPFSVWHKNYKSVKLLTFADAAKKGELVYNALLGMISVKILAQFKDFLVDKILIDITNPLQFSDDDLPTLFVSNTDSLGEQIQRELPKTKVVKTLNTIPATLQTNPKMLADGDHSVFISGNDIGAKIIVFEILKSYGWKNIIDLGDISTSRGTEMFLALWLRLWKSKNNSMFNVKVITEI